MLNKKSRISFIILPIALLLALVCAFSLRAPALAHADGEVSSLVGEGTSAESPKHISDVNEFLFFMQKVNDPATYDEYSSYYYRLESDINLDGQSFSPIGTLNRPFKGYFDGNGKIISNLTISQSSLSYVGLFGSLDVGATVTSVGIVNANIEAGSYVGGIAGANHGTIDKCFVEGVVSGAQYVGGIAGINAYLTVEEEGESLDKIGFVRYSFSNGRISATNREAYVGGVIGSNEGRLQYSYSIAQVVADNTGTPSNFGGIIGGRKNQIYATPTSSFYNKSLNSGISAIGFGANSVDKSEVNLDSTYVNGFSRTEFNGNDMSVLLGNNASSIWTRAFIVSNHSSYVAPLQKIFADRLENADDALIKNLETACSERMYGMDLSSYEEWGTENNPYIINSEQTLRNLQSAVTEERQTYIGRVFRQSRNVTLTSRFYPIGSYSLNRVFQGTYDGNNHKISKLDISETTTESKYLGLFGYIGSSATIENLTLDDTCSVTGTENIGALVGFNYEGTISNVETLAKVSAQGKSGGLVGITYRGSYINVLSKAKLSLRGTVNGGLYGVIGDYQEYIPTTLNNVWYFVETGSDFTTTNTMGSVLMFDGANGEIVAEKNEQAIIIFEAQNVKNGFNVEYRKSDETVVCDENEYIPRPGEDSREVIFARFVKELHISTDNEQYSSVSIRGSSNKFYSGQYFTLAIGIQDGVYLKSIESLNSTGGAIDSLNASFAFDSNTSSVLYTAQMNDSLKSIRAVIETISWDTSLFETSYVYNGKGVKFPVDKLSRPEGYSVIVNYSGAVEPSQANQNPSENYSLTVVYQNEKGVRMGSKNQSFHIDKAQLTVSKDALGNTKEWDNSLNPISATVDQSGVGGIMEDDDVTVSATMIFNTTDIGTNAKVSYKFTISGLDSRNYYAPIDVEYEDFGTITKRKITINFDTYESVFAGLGKAPSLIGKKIISKGVLSAQPYEAKYIFTPKDGAEMGSVGIYELRVELSDKTYPEAKKYYEIAFANALTNEDEENSYTYVEYEVKALPVTAVYLIDGVQSDNVTYDGITHEVTAYFLNEQNVKVSVDVVITNAGGENVSNLSVAGAYNASVANFNNANYNLGSSISKDLAVNKAKQSALIITSALTHSFGSDYVASAVGGDGDGELIFSVAEGSEELAAFQGGTLTIYKAGTIGIVVTKGESANYLAETVSAELVVSKSELEIYVADTTVNYLDEITLTYTSASGVVPTGVEGVNVFLNGELYNGGILDAGEYSISIDVSEATSYGYLLNAGECGSLTVNHLAITVTAHAQESVYGEELKELTYSVSDERVTRLNGSLEMSANNVGNHDITIGTLEESNANYDIEFIGAIYEIKAKAIVVRVSDAEKFYGDADPAPKYVVEGLVNGDTEESIGLKVNIGRIRGEYSYNADTGFTMVYNYVNSGITHSSPNYNLVVDFVTAHLTILPKEPTLASKNDANIAAGTSLSSFGNPVAEFSGKVYDSATSSWTEETLSGTVKWVTDVTPDFKDSATLTYKAKFTPEDKNFTDAEIDITVNVIPIDVTVKFTSPSQITYDGYDHNNVTYELEGVLSGDKAYESVEYTGDYRNVGTFKVKVTINNCNYKLSGGETSVKIVKADLTIKVEDMTVVEGESRSVEFMYFGLQRGDTEDSLEAKPNVTLPTAPGTYTLTPSGAKSSNYNIKCESFKYKVLVESITSKDESVKLKGKFDSKTVVELVEEEEISSEIRELFEGIQTSYTALENKDVEKVFSLNYTIGGKLAEIEGEIYLTMAKPEGYADNAVAYAILDNNGELRYVQNIVYDGDLVTINVTNAKAIVFLVEQEKPSILKYVIIAAIAVVVLVLICTIVSNVKKRRERRYIKYHD